MSGAFFIVTTLLSSPVMLVLLPSSPVGELGNILERCVLCCLAKSTNGLFGEIK